MTRMGCAAVVTRLRPSKDVDECTREDGEQTVTMVHGGICDDSTLEAVWPPVALTSDCGVPDGDGSG